ncbi:MAG: pilus assembly protein [Planctomycetes bacterium]|nr:pilus assembly protein [Planctomycetota bacterium]
MSCKTNKSRRGVGTLELVFALPVLLFITALIINFGVLSTWRIAGQAAARNALWQGQVSEVPPSWQPPAAAGIGADQAYTVLDEPALNKAVARGPLPAANVDTDLLDFSRGAVEGSAQLTRTIPVPPRMVGANIDVRLSRLQDVWTYDATKMSGNVERRTKVLWELAKAPATMSQAYIAAVVAVYSAAYQADLAPLDRESDFPRFGHGSPDFHPRLSSFCGLDAEGVLAGPVTQLIERIAGVNQPPRHVAGVPETMTRSYLSLYKGELQRLENLLNADPPLPAAQRAAIQGQLAALHAELDPKIAQLEAFLNQLTSP